MVSLRFKKLIFQTMRTETQIINNKYVQYTTVPATLTFCAYFKGELKPGKTLHDLLDMKQEKLIKLVKPKCEKEIQVVVFVHSALDSIPEELLTSVRYAIRPDVEGQRCKYLWSI